MNHSMYIRHCRQSAPNLLYTICLSSVKMGSNMQQRCCCIVCLTMTWGQTTQWGLFIKSSSVRHADGQRESMSLQHTPKDNTDSTNRAHLGYANFTVNPLLKVDKTLARLPSQWLPCTVAGVAADDAY